MFTTSRFIVSHVILLVSCSNLIDAAPGFDASRQPPPPFGHMGVTTVCVELRPAPHMGPTQVCGPIVPGSLPHEEKTQPEAPNVSSRSSTGESELIQNEQMQQQQQQQLLGPLIHPFMMRNEPEHQQQQQDQPIEHPCVETQRVIDSRFLDIIPPPQGFFAPAAPQAYIAKAADGQTFVLAPWTAEHPTNLSPSDLQQERAAFDCDNLKTNGIRGFPPRVYNSRTLPLMAPIYRNPVLLGPQQMRAAPSIDELVKQTEEKDKIIAAKSEEIVKLQRELKASNQKSTASGGSSVKSQTAQMMTQSSEKSDVRAVASSVDQQTTAGASAAASSLTSPSEREKISVKRHASEHSKKK